MKTYPVSESIVKHAHLWASSELKAIIEREVPELFEPQSDKWFKSTASNAELWLCYNKSVGQKSYGFDVHGEWSEELNLGAGYNIYIPATTEEVGSALIAEAKKRYEDGCTIKDLYGDVISIDFSYGFAHAALLNSLYHKDYKLFYNGKWAEVVESIKEITMADVEKQFGCKVKIVSQ